MLKRGKSKEDPGNPDPSKERTPTLNRKHSLPEFKPRLGRLDYETFDNEKSEFRGFITLFWMTVGFFLITTVYKNYQAHSLFVGSIHWNQMLRDIEGVLLFDILMNLFTFVAVIIHQMLLNGMISNTASILVGHLAQTFLVVSAIYTAYFRQWGWIHRIAIVPHSLVLYMKMHSYLSTNRELHKKYLKSLKEPEPQQIEEEDLALVHYPKNVTFINFAWYLAVPTLVYRLNYPMNDRIRPSYLLLKALGVVGVLFLIYTFNEHYIYPVLYLSSEITMLDSVIQLIYPMFIVCLLLFFLIFDCICNFCAELTMFADRLFYEDWWNS